LSRLVDVIKVRADVTQQELSFDMGRMMAAPEAELLAMDLTV
jgi:hypothetical protein